MAERIESLVARYKNFLAHASHELGSPLTRLNIALALAKRKAGHQLESEHDRIGQEANRLNVLVQELLLLARLESGNELSRNSVPFDIGELIEDACGDARFEADQSEKTVTLMRQQTFHVRGYPNLLRRALDNLLRNSLRFAKNRGGVEISYFPKEGLTAVGVIVVQDDGPGIPAELEESIFEPFVTHPNGEDAGGSSLGLAIAKQAVLANGGKISAHSTGNGLMMVIELPTERI